MNQLRFLSALLCLLAIPAAASAELPHLVSQCTNDVGSCEMWDNGGALHASCECANGSFFGKTAGDDLGLYDDAYQSECFFELVNGCGDIDVTPTDDEFITTCEADIGACQIVDYGGALGMACDCADGKSVARGAGSAGDEWDLHLDGYGAECRYQLVSECAPADAKLDAWGDDGAAASSGGCSVTTPTAPTGLGGLAALFGLVAVLGLVRRRVR